MKSLFSHNKDNKVNEAFARNEVIANKQLAGSCIFNAVLIVIVWILICTHVFNVRNVNAINVVLPLNAGLLLIPFVLSHSKLVEKQFFKYLCIFTIVIMVASINLVLPKHAILLWAVIIILTSNYYSSKAITFAFLLTAAMMAAMTPLSMLFGEWDANLMGITDTLFPQINELYPAHPLPHGGVDTYDLTDRLYFLNHYNDYYPDELNRWAAAFLYYYAARFICLVSVYVLALRLSMRTEKLLISETEAIKEKGRISTELNVASDIQLSALPRSFPKINKFDVFALTKPAKEVGGDFYNVFIWNDKLLFFIADVSGKGVPAALMMMKTNTLISSVLKNDENPANSLALTNKELNDHNEKGMFVTAFVGCLDLKTGILNMSNAGHNPPLFKRHKQLDYLKIPPAFILGGFPDVKYKNITKKLMRNDVLFIYTDGITEAMNGKGEVYGEERLKDLFSILDTSAMTAEEICHAVNAHVEQFVGDAGQADDITMLCLKYNDIIESNSFVVPVNKKEVERVTEFANNFLLNNKVPQKELSQIDIAIDEICSNIFNYAYKDKSGKVSVDISILNNVVTIVFTDDGEPFNPLEKDDPDIDLPVEERKAGGLGIYLVKKMMDSVSYQYSKNKENILTITKKVGE